MITFNYETSFELKSESLLEYWIDNVVSKEDFCIGEINYIFCDDEYLHKLNVEFLQHDTLTDIISFDNTLGNLISGDIYISIERVTDNAKDFKVSFLDELHRVMIHGVLHYMGYKD
ncbi:MAG: rRNA maturation RNase YbeY, partial [Polaribacter sp.]|nr:rRNA maturation RNase YbeY [Polaribacter sp.]